jgi:hypothetical protein
MRVDGTEPRPGGWNRFTLEVPDLSCGLARARAVPLAA